MSMSITECMQNMEECAKCALQMRRVIESDRSTPAKKYKAIVIEEAHLELIQRYLEQIDLLKQLTVSEFKI
jgi:hypothetical protein